MLRSSSAPQAHHKERGGRPIRKLGCPAQHCITEQLVDALTCDAVYLYS